MATHPRSRPHSNGSVSQTSVAGVAELTISPGSERARHSTKDNATREMSIDLLDQFEEATAKTTRLDGQEDVPSEKHISNMSSTSRMAGKTVAPFLTKHIPDQYAPQGITLGGLPAGRSNTKFCYRHRPDLKCRRQADEPSMDQLQKV
jgi:hypothetical protein